MVNFVYWAKDLDFELGISLSVGFRSFHSEDQERQTKTINSVR